MPVSSAALLYFLIMFYVVLGMLHEVRPIWYYVLAGVLFVLSQLDYFLLNKVICKVRLVTPVFTCCVFSSGSDPFALE